MSGLAGTLRDSGLLGFFSSEAACEAAADHVGPGAALLFGEGVESVECFLADADGLHLSGGHGRSLAYPIVLRNASQWDTVLGMTTTGVKTRLTTPRGTGLDDD